MNKAALVTSGRKLEGGQLYLLSVFDLEPSGIIIHAYNQITSKEYMLPVLEKEVRCISDMLHFYHMYANIHLFET
jgi:hypothetical protein